MDNAAAITAVNRTLAHFRLRQVHIPTDHSAREIAQMAMFAEYLHETHTPDAALGSAQADSAFCPKTHPLPHNRRREPQVPDLLFERSDMNKTETTLRKLLAALPSTGYDLGVLSDEGMYRMPDVSASRLLRTLPYLRYRNIGGAHIYLRPAGESSYTLLDDLSANSLARLTAAGYDPAAVVETSPGNFQAWLRHAQHLSPRLGTLAAKTLAQRFSADGSAADWRRFGRAPGFTNRKPQHRNAQGLYPFARLHSHDGVIYAAATAFYEKLLELAAEQEAQHIIFRTLRERDTSASSSPVALARFRHDPRYENRPAAADMAFAVRAWAEGWTEADIAAALAAEYLSRDSNPRRQAAYIQRTLAKAVRWAR